MAISKQALTAFLTDLFRQGEVVVEGQLKPFLPADLETSKHLLEKIYEEEGADLPFDSPAFDDGAAMWSAQFLYRAVQFALLRELDDQSIQQELRPFPAEVTPSAIIAVDLCMRYLPDLFKLVRGLAPDDVLVRYIRQTAAQWPYSAVGMDVTEEPNNITAVLSDNGLRQIYLERVIALNDTIAVKHFQLMPWLEAMAGLYPEQLLPQAFNDLRNERANTGN